MKNINLIIIAYITALFIGCSEKKSNSTVNIIPRPNLIGIGTGTFTLNSKTKIKCDQFGTKSAQFLKSKLANSFKLELTEKDQDNTIVFVKNSFDSEKYSLDINKSQITISAGTESGLFYGVQSLLQLLPLSANKTVNLQVLKIIDQPKFEWRAYMLDESRYFQGEKEVKLILDEMARLKMNIFHWHLTDDAGWRIEIKKYPLLSQIGSRRDSSQCDDNGKKWKSETFDGTPHSGFYTQQQIREIVAYAAERHIQVIPEIEMPGHSSAAIASYPWLASLSKSPGIPPKFGKMYHNYNVTDPKVVQFLHDVLDEVIELFPSPVIHIGGDEVKFDSWDKSKSIQAYIKKHKLKSSADLQLNFTNKISKQIESKGKRMMGWNEIMGSNVHEWQKDSDIQVSSSLSKNAIVHFWKGDVKLIKQAAEKGYDIVNSHHVYTYLDYNYKYTPLRKAYSFNPIPNGLDKSFQSKIIGLGCQMWTEWTPTNKDVERQTFPRIAAYAEVGWTNNENKDYDKFHQSLKATLKHWDRIGIAYGDTTKVSK